MLLLLSLACAEPPPPPASPEPAVSAPAEPARTVAEAFPVPEGFTRVEGDAFGDWLRDRPVRAADVPVRTHDGRTVGHHARVVDLPLVKGDLQQCADSALRLRAEWLRETGSEVAFHATSGDLMPWARFAAGETPYADGNALKWRQGSTGEWDDYLRLLFTWAGTASLEAHDSQPADTPRPGYILVQGGFPGHAVVLLDVATRQDETLLLVGEGYMPAQDFHVELGPIDAWWRWDGELALPHWTLTAEHLRRFE
ncbi:MAG: hypothetical protein EP330_10475 [Deltaproteobacteria bacterium]|nr:MAG: hypothetical protein EP330_10475 [Deltaproteobacteria bacterium]